MTKCSRKNNLIIKGLEKGEQEDSQSLKNSVIAVFSKVGVDQPEVRFVRRLRNEITRPVLVTLVRETDVKLILANKKKTWK